MDRRRFPLSFQPVVVMPWPLALIACVIIAELVIVVGAVWFTCLGIGWAARKVHAWVTR